MPILKSSKKALKVSRRRRTENLRKISAYKSAIREVKSVLKSDQSKNPTELLKKAKRLIDKALKSNIIHKNKAARIKSRLAKNVSKALSSNKDTKK